MTDLADLIVSIKDLDRENYHTTANYKHLSDSVPNWQTLVSQQKNWDAIAEVGPYCSTQLCEVLLIGSGLELAERWLHSDVAAQRDAAESWFLNNVDKSMWKEFNRDIKTRLLAKSFRCWPGEPLRTIEEYGTLFRFGEFSRIPPLPHFGGYVPDPQVEKLRFIIEDAGDIDYLERLDKMISHREKACQVASLQNQHRIPYSPNSNERELIARLMEITNRSGYLPTALPSILISSETPPIFVAYPELEEENENRDDRGEDIPRNWKRRRPEIISIEELLGIYQPRLQQIIIYERGIKWLGRKDFDEKWLSAVVLIHEIGHWVTHQLPQPGVPTWPTDLYVLGETDVHEGWAQLITWWIADQVDGNFKHTFEKLNRRQSSSYRVFEEFKTEPIDTVMASLEKLRLLQWPARLEDWKKSL